MPQQTHCNGFPVLDLPKRFPAFFHPRSSLEKKKKAENFKCYFYSSFTSKWVWWTHWAVCGSVNGRRQCNWQQRRCTVAVASQSTWQGHVCPQIECWCPQVLVLERSHYRHEMRQNMTEYVKKNQMNESCTSYSGADVKGLCTMTSLISKERSHSDIIRSSVLKICEEGRVTSRSGHHGADITERHETNEQTGRFADQYCYSLTW